MNDRCLNQLHLAWDDAVSDDDWAKCAELIRSIIIYCRQRYGAVAKFQDLLEPKIAYLEDKIIEIGQDDLCAVAKAIAYGRKQICESGEQFGTGFTRAVSETERADIRHHLRDREVRLASLNGANGLGPENRSNPGTDDLDDD